LALYYKPVNSGRPGVDMFLESENHSEEEF